MASMQIFDSVSLPFNVGSDWSVAVLDCNFGSSMLLQQVQGFSAGTHVWIEPTSVSKAIRAVPAIRSRKVLLTFVFESS